MIRSVSLARGRWGALALATGMLWLAGVLALAAPAGGAEPTSVELTVVGGPDLNPNMQGRASPVVVRIFDLTTPGGFESADYQALFERPGDALKQDLVTQEEFVLRPGDIQERNRSLQPQVQVLGVAAAFRDQANAIWHLTLPLKPGRRNFLLIDLDRNTIRLLPVDSGPSS